MGDGLDHFAMWGTGLDDQIATLERYGIEYKKLLVADGKVIQLFFEDPNGASIELGFDPVAEGVTAETFDGEVW